MSAALVCLQHFMHMVLHVISSAEPGSIDHQEYVHCTVLAAQPMWASMLHIRVRVIVCLPLGSAQHQPQLALFAACPALHGSRVIPFGNAVASCCHAPGVTTGVLLVPYYLRGAY